MDISTFVSVFLPLEIYLYLKLEEEMFQREINFHGFTYLILKFNLLEVFLL